LNGPPGFRFIGVNLEDGSVWEWTTKGRVLSKLELHDWGLFKLEYRAGVNEAVGQSRRNGHHKLEGGLVETFLAWARRVIASADSGA
jgi:hypothetical protein